MTGVAAHIVAAAKRGPRSDPSLSAEQRRSEANGIWMCAIHAKWIDDNPSLATVAKLQEWKAAHEAEIKAWQEFGHKGIFASWDRLTALTSDQRGTIETLLPNGYAVPRDDSDLVAILNTSGACLVSGDSGVGKSALVKAVLDARFTEARQIWLGPEALQASLSEASREKLGLTAPLSELLPTSTARHNILVIDAVERADSGTISRLALLLRHLAEARPADAPQWQIVVVGQRAGFEAHLDTIFNLLGSSVVSVLPIDANAVRDALLKIPSLSQHAYDDAFLAVVANLRTLAWIVSASTLFADGDAGKMAARSQIADRLWAHWTADDPELHSFMTALARRDAEYERSFALSDLSTPERAAWKSGGTRLPMTMSPRNRLSFQHDLASDWARYQYLKEIADDVGRWAAFARQPLWVAALRLFGQYLLREADQTTSGWDRAFAAARAADATDAIDVLLDALCLDPDTDKHMAARSELLFADNGKLLDRLLRRFMHIATLPERPAAGADLGLYMEAEIRRPIWSAWPPLIRFLEKHSAELAALGSTSVAKLCHLWLSKTPVLIDGRRVMGRSVLAKLALETARTEQAKSTAYGFFGGRSDDSDEVFAAGLAGADEIPDEVSAFALEMVRRRSLRDDIKARVADMRAERLRASAESQSTRRHRAPPPPRSFLEPKKLPPWPLGPGGRLHSGFRRAILRNSALAPFIKAAPALAAEVLLACIIEDDPREQKTAYSLDRRLGLEWEHDDRPTIFWNSPFFPFLFEATDEALDGLLALVDFCTERWSDEQDDPVASIQLRWPDGTERSYAGDGRVLDWAHTREATNSQLYAALDALERWLWMKISAGADVDDVCAKLFAKTNSAAILGILCDCAKLAPNLLMGVLAPLLTSPLLIMTDEQRLKYRFGSDMFAWYRAGEQLRTIGFEWEQAAHRNTSLLQTIVELRRGDAAFDRAANSIFAAWPVASVDGDLSQRALIAQLDPGNWTEEQNADGATVQNFRYPNDIAAEIRARQTEDPVAPNLSQILDALAQYLSVELDEGTASDLFDAFEDDEDLAHLLPADRRVLENAVASTLIIRGRDWLADRPLEAEKMCSLVECALPLPEEAEMRAEGWIEVKPDMAWACLAAIHAKAAGWGTVARWDGILARGIATGDVSVIRTITVAARGLRAELGSAYHAILEAVVFAAALNALTPWMEGEPVSPSDIIRWRGRLARRLLPATDRNAHLDLRSLALRVERIWRSRYTRARGKELDTTGRRNLHRHSLGLSTELLRAAFDWALVEDLVPPADEAHEHRRVIRMLWDYVDWRMRGDPDEPVEESDGFDRLDEFGLTIIRTIAARTPLSPASDSRMLWEPVLALGPRGEFTVEHMIDCFFLRLYKEVDAASFISNWDEMLAYVFSPGWIDDGKWWRGRDILRHMLGIDASHQIASNPWVMEHVEALAPHYEAFAADRIGRDDSELSAFAAFFAAPAGAALRMRAIRWIDKALEHSDSKLRSNAGSALTDLARIILADHASELIANREALQALNNIISRMVRDQITYALTLQDRARALR